MPRRVGTIVERLLGRHRAELHSGADPVPDAELLARFAATRDESAFELLVWRHAGMVLGVCRRITRDAHLAEDAFQATFLVLARKAGSVRSGNVAGWLFRVARRAGSRATRFRSVAVPLPDVPATIEPDACERSELASLIDEEVGRLPERLRLPVVLCYLGGRTTEDAARELGCPRGTVLSRLATARNRLAARLRRRGVTLPAAGIGIGVLPAEVTTAATLVQRTVQTGLAFTAGQAAAGPAVTLAEGMVRAMTITKLATLVGVFALGIGVTTGMGLVAAQGTRPAPIEPTQPTARLEEPQQPPPPKTAQPDKAAKDIARDQELMKLADLIERLKADLEAREKSIRIMAEANQTVSPERRRQALQRLEAKYSLERELLVEAIKEHTAAERKLRREIEGMKATKGEDQPSFRAAVGQMEFTRKELETARKALTELTEIIDRERAKLEAVQVGGLDLVALLADLEPQREMVRQIERRILELRTGVEFPAKSQPGGVEAKLDAILRELTELRKDVRRLEK